jgi:hypothetical protein
MNQEQPATKPVPPETGKIRDIIRVDQPEREAETLRKFREELEDSSTLAQTSIRTSLLGAHE